MPGRSARRRGRPATGYRPAYDTGRGDRLHRLAAPATSAEHLTQRGECLLLAHSVTMINRLRTLGVHDHARFAANVARPAKRSCGAREEALDNSKKIPLIRGLTREPADGRPYATGKGRNGY